MQQRDLLDIFIAPLEAGKFEYMVTGSVAATFYGEPRLTHDIDLVLALKPDVIEPFLSQFPAEEFYCPPYEVVHLEMIRRTFAHFNLIHHDSGYKADIYPLSNDALHQWGFENRHRVTIKHNLELWLAPPEYVILRKLQYFREGGSQKHLSDIKKMLDQEESVISRSVIQEWVVQKNVLKEWEIAQNFAI
jgi:hypothetical protein